MRNAISLFMLVACGSPEAPKTAPVTVADTPTITRVSCLTQTAGGRLWTYQVATWGTSLRLVTCGVMADGVSNGSTQIYLPGDTGYATSECGFEYDMDPGSAFGVVACSDHPAGASCLYTGASTLLAKFAVADCTRG